MKMAIRLRIRQTSQLLSTAAVIFLTLFLLRVLRLHFNVYPKKEVPLFAKLSSDSLRHLRVENSDYSMMKHVLSTNSEHKSQQPNGSKPKSWLREQLHSLRTANQRKAVAPVPVQSHPSAGRELPDQPNASTRNDSSRSKTPRHETTNILSATNPESGGSAQPLTDGAPDRNLHHLLHIVHPSEGVRKLRHICLPLPETPKHWAKICVPFAVDNPFTDLIKAGILWEGDLVYQMNLALQVHTNLLLVDLGCRIGVYSLWASAVGRPVLAAESDPMYIALMQKTIRANGLDSYITLLANSLSDVRQQATGPTQNPVTKKGLDKFLVHSVCLDDLTPLVAGVAVYLRMDARFGQPRVFSCASVFFRAVFVKIIQVEWVGQSGANRDLITEIMTGYGYTMSTRSTVQTVENMNDSKDVFFLRTSS